MARVLLLDTNISAYPIYQYLHKEGHDVYVAGRNKMDFLAKVVPNYISVDYSDIAALQPIIKKLKFDYLIPGCNDVSYRSCMLINKTMNYPGIETEKNYTILNDKGKFRSFAINNNIPVPKVYNPNNDFCKAKFPIIIKPVDSFSGHGITVVLHRDTTKIVSAISKAQTYSQSKQYLIEEYVTGQLYSHSAFISNGHIVTDVIVEEHCKANPFSVDTSRVASYFSASVLKNIRSIIGRIVLQLGLIDGLLHTQFIYDGDKLWLIEITRRCPGDLYSRLIELTTTANYAENYTRPFLGLDYHFISDFTVKSLIFRHTITDTQGGNFLTLRFPNSVKVREFVSLSLSGDKIEPAPNDRIGILFIEADNKKEFETIFNKSISRTLYNCM